MESWIYLALIFSGVSLAGLIGLFLRIGGVLKVIEDLHTRHKTCPIDKVSETVAVIRRENEILWKSLSVSLGDVAREYNKPERDVLVDKMNRGVANEQELQHLSTLLRNDFVEMPNTADSKSNKITLALLMARVEHQIFMSQIKF